MRYFLGKNSSSAVVDKQAFSGDESKADVSVASYLEQHPGYTAQEVDEAAFNSTPIAVDPAPVRAAGTVTLDAKSDIGILFRAMVKLISNQFNIMRQRDRRRNAVIQASADWNDYKAKMQADSQAPNGQLQPLPDFQPNDVRDAFLSLLNSGNVD